MKRPLVILQWFGGGRTATARRSLAVLLILAAVSLAFAKAVGATDWLAPAGTPHKLLFVSDRGGTSDVWAMNADGTSIHNLTNVHADGPFSDVSDPTPAPDGSKIAFSAYVPDDYQQRVFVMGADGGEARQIGIGEHPVWSPDGSFIAFVVDYDTIEVARADGSAARKVGEGMRSWNFAWSPDGARIAYGVEDGIALARADGGGEQLLKTPPRDDWGHVAWSPDGATIAFVSDDDLYVLGVVDGVATKIASDATFETPAWSPDSSRITFGRAVTNSQQVFVIAADGAGLRQLTDSAGGESSGLAAWSPDGASIVYTRGRFSGWDGADLWTMNADGSNKRALTNAFEQDGRSSYGASWAPGSEPAGGWTPPRLRLVAPPAQTRSHAGRVTELAADAGRAAFSTATGSSQLNCGQVSVWTPATGKVFAFKDMCGAPPLYPSTQTDLYSLGIAGSRVAWAQYDNYIGHTGETLFTGSLGNATPRTAEKVDVRDDDELGSIQGSDSLLAYNTWHWSGNQRDHAMLWRITAQGERLLKNGPDALAAASVDGARIVVQRDDGIVVVLRNDGSVIHRFRFARGVVRGVKLTGSQLAVLGPTTLRIYDVPKGTLRHSWPVQPGSSGRVQLEDVERGYAVYVAGIAIHLLRLSNGRDVVLRLPDEGPPAHAQLEASGLFYSYNETWTSEAGRLGFVPLKRLASLVR